MACHIRATAAQRTRCERLVIAKLAHVAWMASGFGWPLEDDGSGTLRASCETTTRLGLPDLPDTWDALCAIPIS